jgi:hypothetical protein
MNQESQQHQRECQSQPDLPASGATSVHPLLPPCCHSGCPVCVLDYPELFLNAELSREEMEMLEAMEQALAQAEPS